MTYADGQRYVGRFRDGLRHGQATVTFADGRKFVGEYRDDKRNGSGTLTMANGERYVGEYKDGEKSGQGTSYLTDGQVESSGLWVNGKFAGGSVASNVRPRSNDEKLISQAEAISPNGSHQVLVPMQDLVAIYARARQ